MASIYILGAGAMGSLWATHLHLAFKQSIQTHHPVQFLTSRANSPKQIHFLLNSPFLLATPTTLETQLPVFDLSQLPTATIHKPNIILICTKSYHALEACLALKPLLNEHNYLILFQNGLGSQHKIIDALPDTPIFAAVSTEGVNRQDDGTFIHAGKGLTRIGPLNDKARDNKTFEFCVEALTHQGLDTEATENILQALWEKLAINCAINPFTALLNCPNGEIKDSALFKENWPSLKVELTDMLNAADIEITEDELEQRVFKVIESTQSNISSMLQDMRAKRKTEIEDINGVAAGYLKRNGLEHNANNFLTKNIKHKEYIASQ